MDSRFWDSFAFLDFDTGTWLQTLPKTNKAMEKTHKLKTGLVNQYDHLAAINLYNVIADLFLTLIK